MRFLLIRYAEGAGGSFLASVLAASPSAWHWDKHVQNNKTEEACLDYIKSRFLPDYHSWIQRDPKPQNDYNLHFISTKYPRGDDLTIDQFNNCCLADASAHFHAGVRSDLELILPWHKISTPAFFHGAKSITIRLDHKSMRWYHRSLWNKKFGIKDGLIHIKADDPAFNPSRAEYFRRYNNPYLIDESFVSFARRNIINNDQKMRFLDPPIKRDDSIIDLSELLETKSFVSAIQRACQSLSVIPPSDSFLEQSYKYWMSCHA